jgi:DNA (cytosine-5)-methyltransferase 1
VFVVASARNGFNPAEVLFEFDGLRRDIAPSRNKRETVATNVEESVRAYNKQRIGEYSTEDVASTCAARDYKDATDLVAYENFKSVYEMHAQDARVQNVGDVLPTMSATYGSGGGNIPVTYGIAENIINRQDHNGGNGIGSQEELQYTLNATGVHGICTMSDVAGPLDASYYKGQGSRQGGEREFVAQSFAQNQLGECRVGDVFNTLNTNSNASGRNTPMLMTQMAVRRLTPTECERLQGFPDGYTQIPWRNKSAEDCPDGPRYKALGNSWAVPVVAWIGERIAKKLLK